MQLNIMIIKVMSSQKQIEIIRIEKLTCETKCSALYNKNCGEKEKKTLIK